MSLEMRPVCEGCGAATPPADAAWICSFECTFCGDCAERGAAACPNCGGELVPRPRRRPEGDEGGAPSDR
ncbi:MAG: alginate lyase [Planctomycetes bacterium]|nr:alginate lyase [Planctomycetota bacterium]